MINKESDVVAFADDLDRLIRRYRLEFDLSYAEAVGVLQMRTFSLLKEASESCKENE